jgi:quercetin dioxygenase-like cupin family protein
MNSRLLQLLFERTPAGVGRTRATATLGLLAGVLSASCGTPSAIPPGGASPQAQGYSYEELAAGRVDALPSGPQFVRINLFTQAPGSLFPSKTHQPGIVYMVDGVQRYQPATGTAVDLHAGEGYFSRTEAHRHINFGTSENRWYNLALWQSAARSQPLSVPSMVVYETEDIAASDLAAPDIETLRLVTLQANGRTALHSHGGLEVVFVLGGTLRVAVAGQTPVTVGALQGAFEPRGSVVQETNVGGGTVRYLAFFVTPVGVPFETEAGF